jgi:hypothetical protein
MNKDIVGQVGKHISNPQEMKQFCNLNTTHRSYCNDKYFWVEIFNKYNLPLSNKDYQSADDYIREFYAQFYAAKIVTKPNYNIDNINITSFSYYLNVMINIGMRIPDIISHMSQSLQDAHIDSIIITYYNKFSFSKNTFTMIMHTTYNSNLYFQLITPKQLQQFIYTLLIDDAIYL